MFTALKTMDSSTEEVNLLMARLRWTGDESVKNEIRRGQYTCKFCGQAVLPRFPYRRRWHFYHRRDNSLCPYHGESEDHRLLKYQLVEDWAKKYNIPLEHFHIEHRLSIGDAGRIADIYLEHKNQRIAFEIQLSVISPEEFSQRTLDYDNAGIKLYWVFLEQEQWHTDLRRWLALHGFSFISVRFEERLQTERV